MKTLSGLSITIIILFSCSKKNNGEDSTLNSATSFINETKKAFPGVEKLHPDAFGALVSLVFNRGGSTIGPSRLEMLNIKKAIISDRNDIYNYIAAQIIDMKRLWVNKGLDGLLVRRNEESALVKSCM